MNNPINDVPFGKEKTKAERLARAAWELEQASKIRDSKKPVGWEHLVAAHERTARAYEALAREQGPATAASKRVPKTRVIFVVQGNYGYGHGWEDVTAEERGKEGLKRLREYRENEVGVPFRLIRRRERIAP